MHFPRFAKRSFASVFNIINKVNSFVVVNERGDVLCFCGWQLEPFIDCENGSRYATSTESDEKVSYW